MSFLKEVILTKIKGIDVQQRIISTELTLLKMDILACPYLNEDFNNSSLKFEYMATRP